MSHREELLEQLKKLSHEYMVCGADLDRIVRNIERDLGEPDDETVKLMTIRLMRAHREDMRKRYDWDKLTNFENVVWQQLVKS